MPRPDNGPAGAALSRSNSPAPTRSCTSDRSLDRRVQLSAAVRTQDVHGWLGLWMRVDGLGAGESLAFDNMQPRAALVPWGRCWEGGRARGPVFARAIASWRAYPALELLGDLDHDRLPDISFVVCRPGGGRPYHKFVGALLSDLVGVG